MGNACCCQAEEVKETQFDGEPVVVGDALPKEEDFTFDQKLERALRLPLPFFDGTTTMKPEGLASSKEIAALLSDKEGSGICLRILCFTGEGLNLSKEQLTRVSLDRARAIREALRVEGCDNKIAAKGMGSIEQKGAHCLLEICTANEVDTIEAEVSVMLQSSPGGAQPASMELSFSNFKQVVINDREALQKPYDKDVILRAWFGELGSEWSPAKKKGGGCCGGGKPLGTDVTPEVKQLLEKGEEVRADAKLFGKRAEKLAPGAKALTLELAEKEDCTFTFFSQPIGISFVEDKTPLVVSSFTKGSVAMAEGVKTGWTLKAVNGKDVSVMPYNEAFESVKEVQSTLPSQQSLKGEAQDTTQNSDAEQKPADGK